MPALNILLRAVVLLTLIALVTANPSLRAEAPVYGYSVVNVYPHDPRAFTQGLYCEDGAFYEGTGRYGQSSLRRVDIETGVVTKRYNLPSEYFGEGITALRDTIYQLTWLEEVGFSYVEEESGFELIETYPYAWDGWGLTDDDTYLIASDGSQWLRFLEASTRELVSEIEVQEDGIPVNALNELEFIEGRVFANIYGWDGVVVIDAASGRVDAWLDLGGLRDSVASHPDANVLNGIAYDPEQDRLFVTGKLWPKVFEIEVPVLHPSGVGPVARLSASTLSCFPNPCTRGAHLSFELSRGGSVTLRVYDVQGKRVRTLIEEWRTAGDHDLVFDARGLPAGTYFVRLGSERGQDCTRILITH